jgi:hypothetical protein
MIQSPPFEDVINYDKDQFTSTFTSPFPWDYNSIPRVEDFIDDYLQSTDKLDYHHSLLLETNKNHGLHKERQHLCHKLIQEIQAVREISNEKADWTLDFVSEDS